MLDECIYDLSLVESDSARQIRRSRLGTQITSNCAHPLQSIYNHPLFSFDVDLTNGHDATQIAR